MVSLGARYGHLLARQRFQSAYRLLQRLVLTGMNYGFAPSLSDSGERALLRSLARQMPGHVTVFDAGANVGDYAVEVRAAFGTRARIHCFEPSDRAFGELRRRLGTSEIALHDFGLSDSAREAPLYGDAFGSAGDSLMRRDLRHLGRTFEPVAMASLRRLDDVCAALGVQRLDLLKLDIEGHELAALQGAGELLSSGAIRAIQFEFGGCNIDSRTYFRDFWQLLNPRYQLHRVLWDGTAPIQQYDERLEMFVGGNYLATWRDYAT